MVSSALVQITGNVCVGVASLVFLFPLQRLFRDYASQHPSDNRWTMPILGALIPLWLLLLVALLCVTASGGFDWLRLGRPLLYTLTVGASAALATVTFVFIALYIRPGFTPRVIYAPGIYLTPFATGLLAVLSLNQELADGIPLHWLRWPWTILAALSLIGCVGFFGHRLVNSGLGGMSSFARRLQSARARDSAPDRHAQVASLDPQSDFDELLELAREVRGRVVREAATARLRTDPAFAESLAARLESQSSANALEFLHGATLSPQELVRLASPTRTALENFISAIPAPNFIDRKRQKRLLKWGRKTFPVIMRKFSTTDVDFSRIMPAFEQALRPDTAPR